MTVRGTQRGVGEKKCKGRSTLSGKANNRICKAPKQGAALISEGVVKDGWLWGLHLFLASTIREPFGKWRFFPTKAAPSPLKPYYAFT